MLKNIDLQCADPALFECLEALRTQTLRGSSMLEKGQWSGGGPGPICLMGNTWCNGVLLAPQRLFVGEPRVVALEYGWDDSSLGEWKDVAEVRMLITDVHSSRSWTADITSQRTGAFLVPHSAALSANASVIFQMAAGARTGRLYSPPYIRNAEVRVRYRY